MTIVITGASGQLGRLTAEAVLGHVEPFELVLVSRDPGALADFAARGVVVRAGDFSDPATLRDAFAGCERMLLISTDQIGRRVAGHQAAIDAAAEAGVRWIAYTSMVNPSDSNPVIVAAEHRATEEHLRASGVTWTFLRNGIYAETLLPAATAALISGRHPTNAGDGRVSYVSREDCAAVAAAVLTSGGHDGRSYDVTGPDAVGDQEVAALFTELGGRPVEAVPLDDDAYVAAMVEQAGMAEADARAYATFGIGARRFYLAPISTMVQELAGRPPISVRDVIEAGLAAIV
jgi:NAD(P)H dehydrogenase (quinone)